MPWRPRGWRPGHAPSRACRADSSRTRRPTRATTMAGGPHRKSSAPLPRHRCHARPCHPHIHSTTSPKVLCFCRKDPHIHSTTSPKVLRKNPISTPQKAPKSLSRKTFFDHQLFKYSSIVFQCFKTLPNGNEAVFCALIHSQPVQKAEHGLTDHTSNASSHLAGTHSTGNDPLAATDTAMGTGTGADTGTAAGVQQRAGRLESQ
jgi:hypothetical protein